MKIATPSGAQPATPGPSFACKDQWYVLSDAVPWVPSARHAKKMATSSEGFLALEHGPEAVFDNLAHLAAQLCNTPYALFGIAVDGRFWFKAEVGLPGAEPAPEDVNFCTYAMRSKALLEVPDALADPRFVRNPYVQGAPHIRFYAGMPLQSPEGEIIGTLCVLDSVPRQLETPQKEMLQQLAGAAAALMDAARQKASGQMFAALHEEVEVALTANLKRFRQALEAANVGAWEWNPQSDQVWNSEQNLRMLSGKRAAPARSQEGFVKEIIRYVHPDDRNAVFSQMQDAMLEGRELHIEFRTLWPDGQIRWFRACGARVEKGPAHVSRMFGVTLDITGHKRTEIALMESRERLEMAISAANLATWEWDLRSNALWLSASGNQLLGRSDLDPVRWINDFFTQVHPDDLQQVRYAVQQAMDAGIPQDVECRITLPEAQHRWIMLRAASQKGPSGTCDRLTGFMTDITSRKTTELRHAWLGQYDALTGLPNRHLFQERLTQAVEHARRHSRVLALLFLDLDRFKEINDTQGPVEGDRALLMVADRLRHCLNGGNTLARFGGDEFTMILEGLQHQAEAARMARSILHALRAPFLMDGVAHMLTGSIGIALFPGDAQPPLAAADAAAQLLQEAETAMYSAKNHGHNCYQLFAPFMIEKARNRLALKSQLRQALDQGQLFLDYQPQFDLSNGRMYGVEALLRWNHPELGLVSPASFIPLAEETGLIVPIGEWLLEKACRQSCAWQAAGYAPLKMSVNLSPVQLKRGHLDQRILAILQTTGLTPEYLALEVTESLLIEEIEDSRRQLQTLSEAGIQISLDDFGTGYSSLSYLLDLPFDDIKMDGSFVRALVAEHAGTDRARAIARCVIDLAHGMDLKVVAEGVETLEQLDYLRRAGCDYAQGYYFSRPVSAAVIETLLQQQAAGKKQLD